MFKGSLDAIITPGGEEIRMDRREPPQQLSQIQRFEKGAGDALMYLADVVAIGINAVLASSFVLAAVHINQPASSVAATSQPTVESFADLKGPKEPDALAGLIRRVVSPDPS